eukprot:CAMPEP_0119151076 /NCGR_PEP_ID=MMETSP1310-20130426/45821_1 /TAXON_ID=464262 /ORGANISM="Genus nov. species nov., Strain RCC2339" /LENGTH=282 /DNA_ID=CAMNT_0007143325 /DNA_START=385 /DNA_END=1229 /DNA_ORIENTATION=-
MSMNGELLASGQLPHQAPSHCDDLHAVLVPSVHHLGAGGVGEVAQGLVRHAGEGRAQQVGAGVGVEGPRAVPPPLSGAAPPHPQLAVPAAHEVLVDDLPRHAPPQLARGQLVEQQPGAQRPRGGGALLPTGPQAGLSVDPPALQLPQLRVQERHQGLRQRVRPAAGARGRHHLVQPLQLLRGGPELGRHGAAPQHQPRAAALQVLVRAQHRALGHAVQGHVGVAGRGHRRGVLGHIEGELRGPQLAVLRQRQGALLQVPRRQAVAVSRERLPRRGLLLLGGG